MQKGKIFLVGFGPGAESHMSERARQAIIESDVIIGYSTYIDLVKDLLEGKEVVRKGMTEELDRSIEAYEQARQGKTVALVSSGDIGVYGMAGPTYEVLFQSGWTPGSDIEVELVPGATALSACASLVGAPLTHDFCSISLSDLLTPWPVIAKRLEAAARADFVVALYNPKSGRRRNQIVEAQRILLQHRSPDTPVAVVKSAYRDLQDIQMVTLKEMADCKIGMLTTVLIGNSSTFMQHGLMVTPRGYANKYDSLTGEVHEGEKRGRSLSMGLEGWKSCVRQYMRGNTELLPRQVAQHFAMPIGEILDAIAQANDDDPAGNSSACEVSDQGEAILHAATQWGTIRAVVRSTAGAVSELMINAADLTRKGDWLSIENEHFHLHIDWSQVRKIFLMQKPDALYSAHFVDERGDSVFNLSLVRRDGQFDPQALSHYQSIWHNTQTHTETEQEEVVA